MAQTFSQLVARFNNATFLDQCVWSVLFLIRWINDESPATQYHTERMLWRAAAMANPVSMARTMSAFAISDGACTGDVAPTDDQVKAAMEALVNTDRWMLA